MGKKMGTQFVKRCDISSIFFSNAKFDLFRFPWPLTNKIAQCLQETKNESETKYVQNYKKN